MSVLENLGILRVLKNSVGKSVTSHQVFLCKLRPQQSILTSRNFNWCNTIQYTPCDI